MIRDRRGVLYAILPILILFAVQNGIVFAGIQIAAVVYLWQYDGVTINGLINEVMKMLVSTDVLIAFSVAAGAVSLVIFVIWYYRKIAPQLVFPAKKEVAVGRSGKRFLVIPGVVLIAGGAQFVGTFLVEIIARLMPSWAIAYEEAMESMGIDVTGASAMPVILVVYTVIIAPIVEEFAFRGLCTSYAMRTLPLWGANLFSSVLFGFMHANAMQGIYTFAFGLILGYVFAKTGRIWIVVAIHAIFNGISALLSQFLMIADSPVMGFVVLLVSLFAVYFGVRLTLMAYPGE